MSAWRRGLGACVLLVVVLVGALPLLLETPWGTRAVERALTRELGDDVTIGNLDVGFWRPDIIATEVCVGSELMIGRIEIHLDGAKLLDRRIDGSVALEGVVSDPDDLIAWITRTRDEQDAPESSSADGGLDESDGAPWELEQLIFRLEALDPQVQFGGVLTPRRLEVSWIAPRIDIDTVDTRVESLRGSAWFQLGDDPLDFGSWQGHAQLESIEESAILRVGAWSFEQPGFTGNVQDGAFEAEQVHARVRRGDDDLAPELQVARARWANERLEVIASVADDARLEVDLEGLSVERLLDLRQGATAALALLRALDGSVTVEVEGDALDTVTGDLPQAGDFNLQARLGHGKMTLEQLTGELDGIALESTGSVDLTALPDDVLTGRADWNAELGRLLLRAGGGTLRASLARRTVGSVELEDVTTHVQLRDGVLRLDRLDGVADGARFDVTGRADLGELSDEAFDPSVLRNLLEHGELLKEIALLTTASVDASVVERLFDDHRLRDAHVALNLEAGKLQITDARGELDGIPFVAGGVIDVAAETTDLYLDVQQALTVEMVAGVSIDGLRLKAESIGLPPWTSPENIRWHGKLVIDQLDLVDDAIHDLRADFEAVGGQLEIPHVECTLPRDTPATAVASIDLTSKTPSFSGRFTLPRLLLPVLGEVRAKGAVRVEGEGMLVLDPFVLQLPHGAQAMPGVGPMPETMAGEASYHLAAGGPIAFHLESRKATPGPRLPPVRDLVLDGQIDDHHTFSGRARLTAAQWALQELPLEALEVDAAFDLTGARIDRMVATAGGSPFEARGNLVWGEGYPEPWRADLRGTLGALDVAEHRLEQISLVAELEGARFELAGWESGTIDLQAARGNVAGRPFEALTIPARIDNGRLRMQNGGVRIEGQSVTLELDVDLRQEDLPATLGARGDLRIDEVTLERASAQLRLPGLVPLADPDHLLQGTGQLTAARVKLGAVEVQQITAPLTLAGSRLDAPDIRFVMDGRGGSASLKTDLAAAPLEIEGQLNVPSVPFGSTPLRDVKVMMTMGATAVNVRGLQARWGEFQVRGGGQFGLPTSAGTERLGSLDATLALEHEDLRRVTVTAKLAGLALDRAAQPRLSGTLDLKIGEADVLGDTLTNVHASVVGTGGRFVTNALEATWGTGKIGGSGVFDASRDIPTYELRMAAAGVPIQASMGDPLGFVLPIFSGEESTARGNLFAEVAVRGQGLTEADLKRHLTGAGRAELRNGQISGSPLLMVTQGWHGLSGSVNVTADTEFAVGQGRVTTTRDLVVRSTTEMLTMQGYADFDRRLNYRGLVKSLSTQFVPLEEPLRSLLASTELVPFTLQGTLDNPLFELDTEGMLERGMQEFLKTGAKELFKELFGEDR